MRSNDRHAVSTKYEACLDRDPEWAMNEGGRYFGEKSAVHETLRRLARRLEQLGVPYALVGGMALFRHGYRRFTEDVDILVTREGLKTIHEQLEGRGYLPPFRGSKNLRDTENGVRIEFVVAGQYPGDGKPKPVTFPDPGDVGIELGGVKVVDLKTLIELKLASGSSGRDRARDLVDVQEVIRHLVLPQSFVDQLDPSLQVAFDDCWQAIFGVPKRYLKLWQHPALTADIQSLDDLLRVVPDAPAELIAMKADGVQLHPTRGVQGDCAYLVTNDPLVARKYDMHDESEFLDPPADTSPAANDK